MVAHQALEARGEITQTQKGDLKDALLVAPEGATDLGEALDRYAATGDHAPVHRVVRNTSITMGSLREGEISALGDDLQHLMSLDDMATSFGAGRPLDARRLPSSGSFRGGSLLDLRGSVTASFDDGAMAQACERRVNMFCQ